MKKNILYGCIAIVLLALMGISCQSAPKPAAAPPSPPAPKIGAPSQRSLDTVNAARTRAEEARKRVIDFVGPSYFPSEWESAETQFNATGKMSMENDADAANAAAQYDSLTETYNGIFDRTIPLYAQAKEDEIMALRTEVIDTGLTRSFPTFLPAADKTALLALARCEEKDFYAANETAGKALAMYQILKEASEAWLLRKEIDARDFKDYDSESYERADELLGSAMSRYSEGMEDFDAVKNEIAESVQINKQILAGAWAAYAAQRADLANGERQVALDIKADIASKDIYNNADRYYQSAAAFMREEKYKEAAGDYTEAEALFLASSLSAADKRRIAAQAIKDAEIKIEESEETAREAELILTGGAE